MRVGLGRGVGHQGAVAALVVALQAGGPLAGGQDGAQSRTGGGVLDHAPAVAPGAETLGQVEQFHQPVHHVRLQLGVGGAAVPHHALGVDARGEQVADDGGAGGVGGEVGEEVGRLPVGDARHDDLVHVAQHGLHRLALLRRVRGQLRADIAGLHLGEHGIALDLFHVARHPLDGGVPLLPELVRSHVVAHRSRSLSRDSYRLMLAVRSPKRSLACGGGRHGRSGAGSGRVTASAATWRRGWAGDSEGSGRPRPSPEPGCSPTRRARSS